MLCCLVAALVVSVVCAQAEIWKVENNPYHAKPFTEVQKAAEQGDNLAQNDLGIMYLDGVGVSASDKEAIAWFGKSAEQGNAVAQRNLGWMYQNGRGVATDNNEAVRWYRKAAEQGNAFAQHDMATMYRNGWGVEKDPETAYTWYLLAAGQGFQTSLEFAGSLRSELSEEQIRRAEQRAAASTRVATQPAAAPVAPPAAQATIPPDGGVIGQPQQERLEIRELQLSPGTVTSGDRYAFTVKFQAVSADGADLPAEVVFRILQGTKQLFESKPASLSVQSGSVASFTKKDLPCNAPAGSYDFQVVVRAASLESRKTVALTVN
jgi:TPR repeat protein